MRAKNSKGKNENSAKQTLHHSSNWKQAIYESEQEIEVHRKRIDQLERAVGIFQRLDSEGVPWPGASATQN